MRFVHVMLTYAKSKTCKQSSKDARIAQLEELVAEANARDTRSKMIHEEFEKRLSDESQRWAERHAALISGMVGSTPPPGISSQTQLWLAAPKAQLVRQMAEKALGILAHQIA